MWLLQDQVCLRQGSCRLLACDASPPVRSCSRRPRSTAAPAYNRVLKPCDVPIRRSRMWSLPLIAPCPHAAAGRWPFHADAHPPPPRCRLPIALLSGRSLRAEPAHALRSFRRRLVWWPGGP